ncbi:MAG: STAS domain-containing protein [Ectothiorhodospiraceae bacterium]|nr:STAS domain-containing protein [Chromatiales bacterium]MCP5153563.1 STAS domain-containing protein [Ectothiorhodospiraceae bacterium]
MDCEIRDEGGVAIVALTGDVDLETSPRVRGALLDCVGAKRSVLVDMSGVSYIDSSGVASLVEAYQTARKSNTKFGLVQVSEAAMRVLELARLDRVFAIHSTLADGLKDVGG